MTIQDYTDTVSEKKNRPIETDWLPLGEGHGISIAVWENSVTLQKKKKENDKWETKEKITLSHAVIERLAVRFPRFFELTKKKENEKNE